MKRMMRVILIVVSAAALMYLGLPSARAQAPTITSFTPTSGPIGTIVTITGTDFLGATAVMFNNVTATFTVNSVTRITATVPPGATTGPILVITPSGTATSVTAFTVVGGPPPSGVSPIKVFTTTEPETCAQVDTFGTPPILPTRVSAAVRSNLMVYFSSEWSGLQTDTELLLNFMVNDDAGNLVVGTPFEWGLTNNPRTHDSGTVMWSFDGVQAGVYHVFVDARTDPVPGPVGGGNTNNNPTAVIENCALTVFVNPVA
jgi:IPT/TIG domain